MQAPSVRAIVRVSADSTAAIELVNEPQPRSDANWNILYDYFSRAYAIVHAPGRKYAVTYAAQRGLCSRCRFHNAFKSLGYWSKFMPKSSAFKDVMYAVCASELAHSAVSQPTRVCSLTIWHSHSSYLLFSRGAVSLSDSDKIATICRMKTDLVAQRKNYIIHVAEWSPALSDCTRYLNGRGHGSRWDGTFNDEEAVGSCKGLTGDASKFS